MSENFFFFFFFFLFIFLILFFFFFLWSRYLGKVQVGFYGATKRPSPGQGGDFSLVLLFR